MQLFYVCFDVISSDPLKGSILSTTVFSNSSCQCRNVFKVTLHKLKARDMKEGQDVPWVLLLLLLIVCRDESLLSYILLHCFLHFLSYCSLVNLLKSRSFQPRRHWSLFI